MLACLMFTVPMFTINAGAEQYHPPRLVDEADLLSNSEEDDLCEKLDNISDEYKCDVVVATVNDLDGKSATAYADDFFDYSGYGYGNSADGILLLISIDDRDWAISTAGDGIYAFTDAGLDYMKGKFKPYLSDNEFYEAFDCFADLCDKFLLQAETGKPYDKGNMPLNNPPRLVDEADLLSNSEEDDLRKKLDNISDEYKCDVVVATVNDLDGKSATAYADDFFDYSGYGYGNSADGILLLISIDDRDWAISTAGDGIYAFTDAGLDYMKGKFKPYLSDNEFYEAFDCFADLCDKFLLQAETGKPYDKGNMPLSALEWYFIPIAIGIAVVISLIVANTMKASLNSVKPQKSAANYMRQGSMRITNQRENYLYNNVTRVKIESSNSGGGSSTHTSSSGRSHGGASGKF